MTSRIHRFRELTVTHTAYEAWLGWQGSRAGIFEDSDGSWYLRHDAMLSEGGILHSKGGTTSPGLRQRFFFFQRAASCLRRAACYSQTAAGYFLRESCCIWRMPLCLRSEAFNLYDGDIMLSEGAFYILRAIRRLQRTATLRGRHHTFGGRRVVRRGRQSTF